MPIGQSSPVEPGLRLTAAPVGFAHLCLAPGLPSARQLMLSDRSMTLTILPIRQIKGRNQDDSAVKYRPA
jgi:hypothetical protein